MLCLQLSIYLEKDNTIVGEAGGAALGRAADKLFSLSGLFAVRKPKGPTSAAVLNLLKERLLAGERRRPGRHVRRVRARRALPGAAVGWGQVCAVLGVRGLQPPAKHCTLFLSAQKTEG